MVVKSVIGEESQLKKMEDILFQSMSTIPSQVGLVVGKLHSHSDRGFVYGLLPTPSPSDSPESSVCTLVQSDEIATSRKKKGSDKTAPSPSLLIDAEWVAEHARQVSRMLVGGMNVVGIYVWASEGSFKTSIPLMHQVLKGVAQAARLQDSSDDERLLLHISYSPRRWVCRNCMSTSMSSNFQPCDFKMGKLLSSLQYFRCTYNFEIRFPIYNEDINSIMLRDVLQSGIRSLAKELKTAKPLVDGNMVNGDEQFPSEGPHVVELLLPFMASAPMEACRSDEIAGIVIFTGTLLACAYLGLRLPVSQAIGDIKVDILNSLQSRLDIILEESEEDVAPQLDIEENSAEISERTCGTKLVLHELSRNPQTILFPKRVLVPWLPGICVCDYLKESDTFEDVKDHCKEMLSMETWIETDRIVEQEKEAKASIATLSFWDALAIAGDSIGSNLDSNNKDRGCPEPKGYSAKQSHNYWIALIVAVLSLLVGWYMICFH